MTDMTTNTVADHAVWYMADWQDRHTRAKGLVRHVHELVERHVSQFGEGAIDGALSLEKLQRDLRDAQYDCARLEAQLAECQ